VGLKLNGTQQLPVYADGVNILGNNTNIVKKNAGPLTGASWETGLKANTELAKIMTQRYLIDPLKCGEVQVIGNGSDTSIFHSWGNKEQNAFRYQFRTYCLLVCV
jgi:hypothetical protein